MRRARAAPAQVCFFCGKLGMRRGSEVGRVLRACRMETIMGSAEEMSPLRARKVARAVSDWRRLEEGWWPGPLSTRVYVLVSSGD